MIAGPATRELQHKLKKEVSAEDTMLKDTLARFEMLKVTGVKFPPSLSAVE
jgi:hypothetical protein